MYSLLLIFLLGLGISLTIAGRKRQNGWLAAAGAGVLAGSALFFALLSFWGELLWFTSIGYPDRFWTVIWMRILTGVGGVAIGLLGVALLTRRHWKKLGQFRFLVLAMGVVIGALWGLNNWDRILLYIHGVSTDLSEPILGLNTGFYLFTLPFLDQIYWLALWIAVIGLATAIASIMDWSDNEASSFPSAKDDEPAALQSILWNAAVLAIVLAGGLILNVFHLMYSSSGVVAGPVWTDVHVRLPAYVIVAILMVILALTALLPPVQRMLDQRLRGITALQTPQLKAGVVVWASIGAVWFLALGIIPPLVQWVVVEPNEITFERPYIAHNIRFTRHGFGLHKVEERRFPATDAFTRQLVQQNQQLIDNIRLWDWRALDAVYRQFQEIRLYYEFVDVDVDRYVIDGNYRQVMVSARELDQSNLPAQSQTFVNRRFKYTHGYGLTLATVNDFTSEGLPNLLIKDIPPQTRHPELEIEHPQIYYGELTRGPVVVNSEEQEFDYPSGDENRYIRYPGNGGVELSSFWRKFIYGWVFNETRLLFSSYPTPESRILFHRQINERAAMLAPFLDFDNDPYIVLADGRLYWILDAYTTSSYFPYSQPFSSLETVEYRDGGGVRSLSGQVAPYLQGANYVRNAVKVVIDAFEGSVNFYIFEPDDPLIQAWRKVFPELFKDRKEMPIDLQAHVRYPADLLLAQGLIYAKYHMNDPAVFYNQEDLWVRATEKYYAQVQPVQPYYVMWQLPESEQTEFVLILPFTPKNRQVLVGWIAGLSDGKNYGRFLAYKFSKEKRVLGPQQVETKIDQDRFLSGQLSLWDQRGSNVIRGNVLAIPIEETLLYVEPIYLQAETAAYPELRLVVVMHGDQISYAENFDQALDGLFSEEPPRQQQSAAILGGTKDLAQQANTAFEQYLQFQAEQRFQAAAEELQTLRDVLQRLAGAEDAPANSALGTRTSN